MNKPTNFYEVIGFVYSNFKRDYFTYNDIIKLFPEYNKSIHMKMIKREYYKKTNIIVKDENSRKKWYKYKLTYKAINTNKRWGEWKTYY